VARDRQASASREERPKVPITASGLREFAKLLRYLRPYRWRFVLGLLCLALGSMVTLSFSLVLGGLVDAGQGKSFGGVQLPSFPVPPGGLATNGALAGGATTGRHLLPLPNDLNALALVLIGLLVVQAALSYFRIVLFVGVAVRTLADLRRDLFARLVGLPMGFFVQQRVGELQSRLNSDISQIGETINGTLAEMIRGMILFLVGLSVILWLSPQLTLVMLSSFPVVVVVAVVFGRRIRKLSRTAQDRLAEANTVVGESLQNVSTVKAFGNEAYEYGRYRAAIADVVAAYLKNGMWSAGFAAFIITALFGSIVLVLWYGSRQVQQGLLTVGELVTFFTVTMMVGASMAGFGEQFAQVQRALGATERVRELLGETAEVNVDSGVAHGVTAEAMATHTVSALPQRAKGAVAFERVAFHYASRPEVEVLSDISFEIPAGRRVALVGASGAGKSTLVQLLQRFYDPTGGQITLDGAALPSLELSWLRHQMASVAQDVQLFAGTIAENLRYGKLDASTEELQAAAAQANALEFILGFPQGFDTLVGERGVKLSGGQRQRIAIARALLRDPAILILDEATSALDAESEAAVQEALDRLMQGRTTLVVAHRLATVRSADQIVVLEGGRIVERGTHEALMQVPDGIYRNFATLQFMASTLVPEVKEVRAAEAPLAEESLS